MVVGEGADYKLQRGGKDRIHGTKELELAMDAAQVVTPDAGSRCAGELFF
jgi:hypothetical protein